MDTHEGIEASLDDFDHNGLHIWECPYNECGMSIIGRFGSLRKHVTSEHPLWSLYESDQLERVHQQLLQSRIQNEMVVEDSNGE